MMGTVLLGMFFLFIFAAICGIVSLIPTFCSVFAILFWISLPCFMLGLFLNLASDSKSVFFVIGSSGLTSAAVVFAIAYLADILRSFVDFIVPGSSNFVPLSAELLFFPWC